MLSILIPVFNYDIVALVKILDKQLQHAKIDYEILCLDDCSSDQTTVESNKEINQLPNVSFKISSTNDGRNKTRRKLAESAKYDWLLFIDADALPKSDHFITNYLKLLESKHEALYGGFAYHHSPPNPQSSLRWKYGMTREQVSASIRNQNPYKIIISANCLIRKSLFLEINSKITEKGYGYDNYFAALLKANNHNVFHLDNEVFHLGIEPNAVYLNKVKQSVENLLKLHKTKKVTASSNDLLIVFLKVKAYGLNHLFAFFYKNFKNLFERNLLSKTPSIKLLQFYKLSYICYKDLN